MKRLFRLPVAIAAIGLAAGTTVVSGAAAVLAARPEADERSTPPSAFRSAPSPPAAGEPAARAGQPPPLRRVVPPDILAISRGSITRAQAYKIKKLPRVRDVIFVDAGAVRLQGRQANVFAVDPSAFRSWTPPATAAKPELWTALARDEFVMAAPAYRKLGMRPGLQYPIMARSSPMVTMGGAASLGMPGVDLLVSRGLGGRIGLIPNLAAVINAPGGNPGRLEVGLRKILGRGAQVLNLHEKKNQLPVDETAPAGRPDSYLGLYRQAATACPGLSWTVLAAIGQIESGHGRNNGPSTAGALGPMQFLPATWRGYGVDGDGDGRADIMNPYDAVPSAAKYLCVNGAGQGGSQLSRAIWRYNHSTVYVRNVLGLARAYTAAYA